MPRKPIPKCHKTHMQGPACDYFKERVSEMVKDGTISAKRVRLEADRLSRSLGMRADTGKRKPKKKAAKRKVKARVRRT